MSNRFSDIIFSRRSIRKYTSQKVDEGDVKILLQAAMAAPSAANRRPWHFIVITERKTLDELAESHKYGKMLFDAPLCIVACGDLAVAERFWVQDCSAATENILLAATSIGLGAVWLGVHPSEGRVSDGREILEIPEGYTPLNLISIGHPDEEKESRTQYEAGKVHSEKW